jgi:hypothetical protein
VVEILRDLKRVTGLSEEKLAAEISEGASSGPTFVSVRSLIRWKYGHCDPNFHHWRQIERAAERHAVPIYQDG